MMGWKSFIQSIAKAVLENGGFSIDLRGTLDNSVTI